ncbi:MAG: DUF294 nucleotidyltransferase-like domain-containing protein [Bacteroidia bacterium]|nr:DUF294 nucleotidyltransferase-like domain-containing protein [Bacteroidia bacterium]
MNLSQSLATRTADFLAAHPPFSLLPRHELEQLAGRIEIRFFGPGDVIFEEGGEPGQGFYVLNKGRVELHKYEDGELHLADVCEVSDPFGVRALLSDNPYIMTARVAEEALVYFIPRKPFAELMERYPKVGLFFASGLAAGMTVVRGQARQMEQVRRELSFQKQLAGFREEDIVSLNPHEEVVFCTPVTSIRDAAQMMAEYRIGSIVVADTQLFPAGIITSTDLARKVATGRHRIDEPASAIMSSPVLTVTPGLTVARAILTMVRHQVRHLVVTEDGTPKSRFIGIVSERDVLLSQSNNPATLVKQLLKARTVAEMAEIRDRAERLTHDYLKQEISVAFISETLTEINDVLIRRAIELSLRQLDAEGLQRPQAPFCWLSLGSEGRGEQLLRTDQDNALIYADPPEADAEHTAAYYLRLGKAVTDILEQCGFAHCPGEIMASNPQWNQPMSGWKAHFTRWIQVPDPKALMHGTIFFDFRPAYGEFGLAGELRDHLDAEMDRQKGFINFLAANALGNPPPLSFLNNFIVERSGGHKDEFDIKLRAMMPLADAARVMILDRRVRGVTNTFRRYEQLAELEPQNARLLEEAGMAYELMIRYRALNGFEHGNSGRYLNPNSFNKIEKQTLKYAFRTIEELQRILKTRYSLSMFGS